MDHILLFALPGLGFLAVIASLVVGRIAFPRAKDRDGTAEGSEAPEQPAPRYPGSEFLSAFYETRHLSEGGKEVYWEEKGYGEIPHTRRHRDITILAADGGKIHVAVASR